MWIKEAFETGKLIRQLRKSGETKKLALIPEEELVDMYAWLAKRDHENQLMQQCIIEGTNYVSPCNWCAENQAPNHCEREQNYKKGCKNWWLRFLTEDEEKECEERVKKQMGEQNEG